MTAHLDHIADRNLHVKRKLSWILRFFIIFVNVKFHKINLYTR